jgi:hypothetical protein
VSCTIYQKPVIDNCPWPSSQFNKWHAQNKLLSSSLIVIGSMALGSLPPQTSEPLSRSRSRSRFRSRSYYYLVVSLILIPIPIPFSILFFLSFLFIPPLF